MNHRQTDPHRDFAIDYDLKNFIDDTIKTAIEEAVQSSVDKELLLLVRGGGFKIRLNALIDSRLHALADEIAFKTTGAGPGRGHTGRTHKKISLSLPATLYDRARELPGFFSCHVAGALELYLKLQEK